MELDQPVLPFHQNSRSASFHPASPMMATGAHSISTCVPTKISTHSESIGTTARLNHDRIGGNPSTSDESYLHWCIDSNASDTLLFPLLISRLDDTSIVQRLRTTYQAVKGLRKWLLLTDIETVKFVLVLTFFQSELFRELMESSSKGGLRKWASGSHSLLERGHATKNRSKLPISEFRACRASSKVRHADATAPLTVFPQVQFQGHRKHHAPSSQKGQRHAGEEVRCSWLGCASRFRDWHCGNAPFLSCCHRFRQ